MTKSELKGKTVEQIKKLLDKNGIAYSKSSSKDELIELALKKIIDSTAGKKTKEKPAAKTRAKKEVKASSREKVKIEEKNQPEKKEEVKFEEKPQVYSSQQANYTEVKQYPGAPLQELPEAYGKDRLIFLIRDPAWGFVYWEIESNTRFKHNLDGTEKYLRIYDITDSNSCENCSSFFDIKIDGSTNNWYINLQKANRSFIVDYGYFKDNNFVTVLRSNTGKTPRDAVSDQIDQEWMLTDEQFRLIFLASGADSLFKHDGSQELMKFISGNVEEGISSGGASITSPVQGYKKK